MNQLLINTITALIVKAEQAANKALSEHNTEEYYLQLGKSFGLHDALEVIKEVADSFLHLHKAVKADKEVKCPACGDDCIHYGPVEYYSRTINTQTLSCLRGKHMWTRRVK
jgi:hypothetical protein